MASQPQPPTSIVLGNFTGVKNTVNPERLRQGELETAVNVDIDDAGQLMRRRGRRRVSPVAHHSIKTIDGITYGVRDGVLGTLDTQYNHTPLGFVGAERLVYVKVGSVVYFSSRVTSGKIVNGGVQPWGAVASEGQWVSPVLRPTDTLGAISGKLLGAPPNATTLGAYKGRIYLGAGPLIWATELYLYDLVDKTRNYMQFEDDVTMIAPMADGIYVGTTSSLLFMLGDFKSGFKLTEVVDAGVVPGSDVWVPYSKVDPRARSGAPVPEGSGPVFMTTGGICVGMDGGQVYNLTQDHVIFPGGASAAAVYREDRGVNSFVATVDSGGTPGANVRIGDYADAEIVRAVDRGL